MQCSSPRSRQSRQGVLATARHHRASGSRNHTVLTRHAERLETRGLVVSAIRSISAAQPEARVAHFARLRIQDCDLSINGDGFNGSPDGVCGTGFGCLPFPLRGRCHHPIPIPSGPPGPNPAREHTPSKHAPAHTPSKHAGLIAPMDVKRSV